MPWGTMRSGEAGAFVLAAVGLVVVMLALLVAVHIGYLAATRRHPSLAGSAVVLAGLIASGATSVWRLLEGWEVYPLQLGAVSLFLAGGVVYLELRSLLSRGYSLRILLDLGETQGDVSVETLRATYGNGVGMRGLLRRRLETLARCGVVHMEGARIGPLTPLGVACAHVTSWVRHALRMEHVHPAPGAQ